jgi:hypothetical protein
MDYDTWLTSEPEPAETYEEACAREDARLEWRDEDD